LRIFFIPFQERYSWILFLAISFLITMGITFAINLIIPCANNRNNAIWMAVPTLVVFYYFIAIRPFFTNGNPNNWLEDVGFQLIWALILSPLLGFILLLGMASMNRLGVKVNDLLKNLNKDRFT
jgi:hypothetical protein